MTDGKKITVIALAGGKSSRMGADKGLLDLGGIKMIEQVLKNVKLLCGNVLIISNNTDYKMFGYPVFKDIHKNCGPLGGIHAGLSFSTTDWNLVIGCDLPFVTPEFISFLFSNIPVADTLIPVHDSLTEPLCALYNKSALQKIESLLLKRELKMQTVLKQLNSKLIEVPKNKFNAEIIFKNINSPKDVPSQLHS